MTETEIFAAITSTGDLISQDFEFFITTTFAVIFVVYAVGEKLTLFPRIVVSALYLSAVALFLSRYLYTMELYTVLNSQLADLNSPLLVGTRFSSYATSFRLLIYIFGSLATVYSIFRPTMIKAGLSDDK